tara:strand:- start:3387 stop:3500 length:114 start_codon:yes stop_codon:yes gene_type:complete
MMRTPARGIFDLGMGLGASAWGKEKGKRRKGQGERWQ